MAVVLSLASRQYTPRTIARSFSVPAGTMRLVLSLTREGWPAGHVGQIKLTLPDGRPGEECAFEGGDILSKDRQTVLAASHMVVEESAMLEQPDGPRIEVPIPIQVGTYRADIVINQTVTTAVRIERF